MNLRIRAVAFMRTNRAVPTIAEYRDQRVGLFYDLLGATEENENAISILYEYVTDKQLLHNVVSSTVFEAQWEPAKEVRARVRDREGTVPGIIKKIGGKWGHENAQLLTLLYPKHSVMEHWLRLASREVGWEQMQRAVNRSMLTRLTGSGPGLSKTKHPAPTDI